MKKIYLKACCVLIATSLFNITGLQAQEISKTEQASGADSTVHVAFKSVAREDLLGGVSVVDVEELLKKNYGTYSLDNLQSFVGGYTGNVWGQEALILVDGIPRQAADVRLVEIATISVLKGASAVVLYGSNAAKGVILITTKRGNIKPLSIDVRANTGMFVPKRFANYLGAADYMTLYNEASRNDGIAERYTQGVIDSTRSGVNPFRYADVDFFNGDYLRKAYSRSDITTEISGGNDMARYYTNLGLSHNNSIMNYGDQKNNKDLAFNVRGNVDMNLSKWLSASADAVVNISNSYTGRGNFWGASNTLRRNWFSPLIPISMLDTANNAANRTTVENSNNVIDGKYLLGGLSTDQTNAFADMLAAGYIKRKNRTFLYQVTAKADLGAVVKGLSFSSGYSMDYRSVYSEAYQVAYATYEPTWSTINGQDVITSLRKYGADGNTTTESIGQTTYEQTMSFRSQFNYDRSFAGKHNVTAALLGWWYMTQFSSDPDNDGGSDYHPLRNTNLGFQAGYNYRRKYYVDFSGALVHSAKLPPGGRNAVSPTLTVGWRISDEAFMKNTFAFVDNLKLTASYASIKQDLDITGFRPNGTTPTDYYLYAGFYGNDGNLGGWYPWRDGASGGFTTLSGRGGNPNLTFIERNELRAGLEASLFKGLITLDANYFLQNTNGLLTRGATLFPSYFTGSGDFRPYLNYNNDRRSGVDFALNVNNKVGKLNYSVGVTGMFFSSKAVQRDEVYQDAYQYRAGKNLDAYWGYISEGLFQSQDEINNHPRQTFGGTLKPGDIKYRDVNGDGIIDTKDQVDLGRNGWAAAPFTYGVNLTLKWKNLTLFALGNGQTGAIGFKNTSEYWVRGTNVFTDKVWDRWTEPTKSTATFPRLTTTAGNNNYQNSSFWMYKTNRFNLTRIQLTYDLNEQIFKKSFVHGLSLYVAGDNLLVAAKERELMETNIGSAPQFRFYNLGVKAAF
ncbi:SusC/RagA family TonB-linked outer membrane protein [Segetibacter sp. 3557_3]|uniref:SusC/RagA family TonB-linked outer membrane protein n=1 Tax=Segetibacter sp. 3557_3 TaxID=2547429 RepID=UPI00105842F9|nr:SusC/RagA family TonB-linked outer membrane protein [Segetibacter sp. 3557_3]TDH23503.1 SusC/RagA family TonB-linked outer membrane protein [Segetibacter sp. 3557_3]